MLRKFLRRVLPSHETIRSHRCVARLGHRLQHHNLWHLHRRAVAGGVAAGMFAGLIPGSNPVQFFVGALLAVRFKVNLPLAMLVTLYSNPLTVVPLYYLAFKLGQWVLLQGGDRELPAFNPGVMGDHWLAWPAAAVQWLLNAGAPLLAGVPLLALLLAAIGYFCTDRIWRWSVQWQWHRRKQRRNP